MTTTTDTTQIEEMFGVGAHYACAKSRRHPSAKNYIFGAKNNVEIFDLEKTADALEEAKAFVKKLGSERKTVLFVAGKYEAQKIVRETADNIDQPWVIGRWIGGTLTNFGIIRKRVEKLMRLVEDREKGDLERYTKKERVLIDRDIERMEENFGGLRDMKKLPGALFVIDSKQEAGAVKEAQDLGIPVVALASSDCDLRGVEYAIPANDANIKSIKYFVEQIAESYKEGIASAPAPKPAEKPHHRAEAKIRSSR